MAGKSSRSASQPDPIAGKELFSLERHILLMNKLTPQQQIFVSAYLENGQNGTRAAIAAKYSEKTAAEQASRLLRDVKVRSALDEGLKRVHEKAELTAERVLLELKHVALSDIGQAFNEDGTLKPFSEMSEDIRRTISRVDVDELFEGHGDSRTRVGETKKIRLWDKGAALVALAKHFKLLTETVEIKTGVAEKLSAARERARHAA